MVTIFLVYFNSIEKSGINFFSFTLNRSRFFYILFFIIVVQEEQYMTVRSYYRGHEIYYKNNKWYYLDNNNLASKNIRPCKKCGKVFEGSNIGNPDPCLANLPGVDNACCGHGIKDQSYIRFTNGVVIKNFDIEYTEEWKGNNI